MAHKKNMELGDGESDQKLMAKSALAKDQYYFTVLTSGGSQPPWFPATETPAPILTFLGTCIYKRTHIWIRINE